MPAHPLLLEEREEIRVGIAKRWSNAEIGRQIVRGGGTVGREINRNGGRQRYCAVSAQKRADKQRRRPKPTKLESDKGLAAHVARRLKAKDSPMTISIELARGTYGRVESISHESIYQAIYQQRGLTRSLYDQLHLKRRRRKTRGRVKPNSNSLGEFNPISSRPAIANSRMVIGHIEGDLIVGAYNRSALITLFDRTSRKLWIERVKSKSAADTYTSLLRALNRIAPHVRGSMTWDQGAEIARWADIAHARQIDIYIADPKSPWQRPTNENGNALIRRYVGKSTDLSTFTTRQLRQIEQRINTIPRRSLNWRTANDIYTDHLAMTS